MGLFGNKLRALMGRKSLTFAHLSKLTGLSASGLNNIATNELPSPDRVTVEKVLRAFPDPDEIYELSAAHLDDELPSPARALVIISRAGYPRQKQKGVVLYEGEPKSDFRLDAQFEHAISRIRRCCPQNESLRLAIIDLADAVSE